ncbi:MAG: hypothetical protein ACK500_08445 [Flavobacteriales bacterium]
MGTSENWENNNDSQGANDPEEEHCVILAFNYGLDSMQPLYDLQDQLDEILRSTGHGDCDGHEIATDMSDGFLYLYGKNAQTIFETVKPILEDCPFMRGSTITLRFGPPEDGVKEIEMTI